MNVTAPRDASYYYELQLGGPLNPLILAHVAGDTVNHVHASGTEPVEASIVICAPSTGGTFQVGVDGGS